MDRLYSSRVQFRRILVIAALLILLSVPVVVVLESETETPPLTEALLRGDYALLEQEFTDWQRAYEDGSGSEWTVDENFNTFYSSVPEFEGRLNEWVDSHPNSYAAPMARALYWARRLSLIQANLEAKSIPDSVFDQIESLHQVAMRDYLLAIQRNNKLTVAYAGLITVKARLGDGNAVDRIYEQGLREAPDSAAIQGAYLGTLWPDWNPRPGSFEQKQGRLMAKVRELTDRYRDNPDFDWLDGYDHLVAAAGLKREGCNDEALAEYGKAIAARANWYYYRDRAVTKICLAKHLFTPENKEKYGKPALQLKFNHLFQGARADLEQAVRLSPRDTYVRHMAGIYREELCSIRTRTPGHVLDQCLAAMAHLRTAYERDPLDPHLAVAIAALAKKLNPRADVRPYLDNALVFGNWSYRIHRHVAMSHFESDPAAADEHFRTAIRLAPTEKNAENMLRDYLIFRIEQRSCDAFPVLEEVERICRGGAECARRFDHILDAFQMRAGQVCGAVLGPVASKPLPMPDDVVPQ